jgi:tetratricopeptide (TPR) repeat protein
VAGAVGEPHLEAEAAEMCGNALMMLGAVAEAAEAFLRSLPCARADSSPYGITHLARLLCSLAEAYLESGETQKSMEALQESLPLVRTGGDRHQEAAALLILGNTYVAQGLPYKAIEAFETARTQIRGLNLLGAEARILGNLALVYGSLGESEKKLTLLREALAIHSREKD